MIPNSHPRRLWRWHVFGAVPLAASLVLGGCNDSLPPADPIPQRRTSDPLERFEPRPRPIATQPVQPTSSTPAVDVPIEASETPAPPPTPDPSSVSPVAEEGFTSFLLVLELPPDSQAPKELDDLTRQDLLSERESLRRQLREVDREAAEIARIPIEPPPPANTPAPGKGFAGTIRDLNLASAPRPDAETVMRKRGMRLTMSLQSGGVSQDFLSGATGSDGQRFSARSVGTNQLVQALVLSPATIEFMARLEREEIQRRGLNPARTYVRKIVFGVVGQGESADLGILELEAVPVNNPSP